MLQGDVLTCVLTAAALVFISAAVPHPLTGTVKGFDTASAVKTKPAAANTPFT